MPQSVKYLSLSILSGLLCWVAWPTSPLFIVIFIAWLPILWVEHQLLINNVKKSGRKLFVYAYIFFLVWNVTTTWWVKNASLGGSIAAFLLNSLFMCIPFLLFHKTKKRFGNGVGYFALICFWLTYEYFHQNWEITWPWLVLGNVFADFPSVIQWYEFTGNSGGTLWVLLVNIVLFIQIQKLISLKNHPNFSKLNAVALLAKPLLLITIPIIISLLIFINYEEKGKTVDIVVLQPNIDAYEKFDGNKQEEYLDKFLRLSASKLDDKVDYLVWPETSIPQAIWLNQMEDTRNIKDIRKFMENFRNLTLVTGITALENYGTEKKSETAREFRRNPGNYYDVFNAAIELNAQNIETELYIKSKLVPGVERMPYPGLFKFLGAFAIDLGGTAGSMGMQDEREVFCNDEDICIAPVICYESVFAEYVTDYIELGAEFIFIITNDDWWGNTPGHRQHLRYASLRAIENRRAIARSANTGISCFIDQKGVIYQATNYKEDAVLRGEIQANTHLTFFTKYGDIISRTSILLSIILLLNLIVKGMISKNKVA